MGVGIFDFVNCFYDGWVCEKFSCVGYVVKFKFCNEVCCCVVEGCFCCNFGDVSGVENVEW